MRGAVFGLLGRPLVLATLFFLSACSGEPVGGTSGSLEMYESPQTPPEAEAAETTETTADPASSTQTPDASPEEPSYLPTDEQCRHFAATWIAVHRENDALAAYALVDWDMLYDRALAGVDATPSLKEQFIQHRKRLLQGFDGVQKPIAQLIKQGRQFTLLRVREQNGAKVAIFRILKSIEEGADYQVVELGKSGDGTVLVRDFFLFTTGTKYSEEVRNHFFEVLVSSGQAPPGVDPTQIQVVHQLRTAILANKPLEAFQFYKTIPESLRYTRRSIVTVLQACRMLAKEVHVQALEQFLNRFPDDPARFLLRIELALVRRDPREIRAGIDQLRQAVGGDPYLDLVEVHFISEYGNLNDADQRIAEILDQDPKFKEAYLLRLAILAKLKRYDDMIPTMDACANNAATPAEIVGWLSESSFAEFLASPAYRDWEKRHPNVPQPTP